jgi:hypothetical protein
MAEGIAGMRQTGGLGGLNRFGAWRRATLEKAEREGQPMPPGEEVELSVLRCGMGLEKAVRLRQIAESVGYGSHDVFGRQPATPMLNGGFPYLPSTMESLVPELVHGLEPLKVKQYDWNSYGDPHLDHTVILREYRKGWSVRESTYQDGRKEFEVSRIQISPTDGSRSVETYRGPSLGQAPGEYGIMETEPQDGHERAIWFDFATGKTTGIQHTADGSAEFWDGKDVQAGLPSK